MSPKKCNQSKEALSVLGAGRTGLSSAWWSKVTKLRLLGSRGTDSFMPSLNLVIGRQEWKQERRVIERRWSNEEQFKFHPRNVTKVKKHYLFFGPAEPGCRHSLDDMRRRSVTRPKDAVAISGWAVERSLKKKFLHKKLDTIFSYSSSLYSVQNDVTCCENLKHRESCIPISS